MHIVDCIAQCTGFVTGVCFTVCLRHRRTELAFTMNGPSTQENLMLLSLHASQCR